MKKVEEIEKIKERVNMLKKKKKDKEWGNENTKKIKNERSKKKK